MRQDAAPVSAKGRLVVAGVGLASILILLALLPRSRASLVCPADHALVEGQPPSGPVAWCEQVAPDGARRKDGPFTAWHPSGRRKAIGAYRLGLADGPWTFWDANGRRREVGEFREGREDGVWVRWYVNGELRESGLYRQGIREGRWTFWFANGRKASEGEYRDGVPVGAWRHWNQRGDPCPVSAATDA